MKFNLAVDAIYAAEALTVDEEDIKAEMDLQKEQYKVSVEEVACISAHLLR